MFDRLAGMETEYAIRFQSPSRCRTPNKDLYPRFVECLRARLPMLKDVLGGYFFANGGHVKFEGDIVGSLSPAGGVLEGATPECRGPAQVLLYSRALDVILSRAVAAAAVDPEEITLIKHNRDTHGNAYGCHENYDAVFAGGWQLLLWRALLILLFPVWMLTIGVYAFWVLYLLLGITIACWMYRMVFDPDGQSDHTHRFVQRWYRRLLRFSLIPFWWAGFLVNLFAFRRQRRLMTAFLVTRQIITGSGSLAVDGSFRLSPRSFDVGRVGGNGTDPSRAIFYLGNFSKMFMTASFSKLCRPRQRLQIAVGDSNMAQTAEFLKFGTTLLVLDAVEAGALDDAPRLREPITALHAINADPTLTVEVPLQDARTMTALSIQKLYLDACERYVASQPMKNGEAERVLALWRGTLDALEHDRDRLIGQVDWITKKHLLDRAGANLPPEARHKIDLRYHELTHEGYYLRMEGVGLAATIVEPEAVMAAMEEAPANTRAAQRGRLIKELAGDDKAVAAWDHIAAGDELKKRRILLKEEDDGTNSTTEWEKYNPVPFAVFCLYLPIALGVSGYRNGFQDDGTLLDRLGLGLIVAVAFGFSRMAFLATNRGRFQRPNLRELSIIVGTSAVFMLPSPCLLDPAKRWGALLIAAVGFLAILVILCRWTFGSETNEIFVGVVALVRSAFICSLFTVFFQPLLPSCPPGFLAGVLGFVTGIVMIPFLMWYSRLGKKDVVSPQ